MSKSLLEELPKIVADDKKVAERILEQLEGRHRVTLQTRELVIPSKDTVQSDLFRGNVDSRLRGNDERESGNDGANNNVIPAPNNVIPAQAGIQNFPNRLIYGDNLLAMAALLAGDETTPSLRGKIDLIYIDPPFDSKADYRTKVLLPGVTLEQKPTVIEQFAYSDTWSDGTASYLAMIVPRLV